MVFIKKVQFILLIYKLNIFANNEVNFHLKMYSEIRFLKERSRFLHWLRNYKKIILIFQVLKKNAKKFFFYILLIFAWFAISFNINISLHF